MGEKFIFPATDSFKIGRITYKVSAHFGEKYDHLKPKIEKLLKQEIESGAINNQHSQKRDTV